MVVTTAAAATQAGVTAATIRTWCRRNVIAAIKQAGRWIIDAASLNHRITLGQRKARPVTIDLNATYTATLIPGEAPTSITPVVKRRSTPHAGNVITVSGLAPFFADRFDAIADDGDRAAALTVFRSARIIISDTYDAEWDGDPQAREGGQLRTTYRGGVAHIAVADVLDLAARLREAL
jgi:hypothetical protein